MADYDDDDLMSDEALLEAIDAMHEEGDEDVSELLKMMNENRIISWEEAERILSDSNTGPIKCSLPPQTRPSEPDNDTDVEQCIRKLQANDPNLTQINLNNMKRIAVPQIRRIIDALRDNGFLEKLSLANMGLYDHDIAALIDVLKINETLRSINLETNYLSGDFFARLFEAALENQTLEEVKAVNQGISFSTEAERAIINSVFQNRGLTKVSITLRLPEGRHKVDQAMLRNQEIRRVLRRQMAEEQRRMEAEKTKKPEPEPPKKAPAPAPKQPPPPLKKKDEPMPVYPLKKPKDETPKEEPESPKKKVVKKKKEPTPKAPETPKKLPEVSVSLDVNIIRDTSNDHLKADKKIREKRKVDAEKVKKKIMTDAFKKLTDRASAKSSALSRDAQGLKKGLMDNAMENFKSKISEKVDSRPLENGPIERTRLRKKKDLSSSLDGPILEPKKSIPSSDIPSLPSPRERPIKDLVKEEFPSPSLINGADTKEEKDRLVDNGPTKSFASNGPIEDGLEPIVKKKKKIIKRVPKKKVSESDVPESSQSNGYAENGEPKTPKPTKEKIPKIKSMFEGK